MRNRENGDQKSPEKRFRDIEPQSLPPPVEVCSVSRGFNTIPRHQNELETRSLF